MTHSLPWNDAIEERAVEFSESILFGANQDARDEVLAELLIVVLEAVGRPVSARAVIRHVNEHLDDPVFLPQEDLSAAIGLLFRRRLATPDGDLLRKLTKQDHPRAQAEQSRRKEPRADREAARAAPRSPPPLATQFTLAMPPTGATLPTATLLTGATGIVGPGTHTAGLIPVGRAPLKLVSDEHLHGRRSYRLETKIGQGGMGEVWRASPIDELGPPTPVAIKTVRSSNVTHSTALQRELDLLRALSRSDFFPSIHEDFTVEGQLFIVMDWVDGQNLHQLFAGQGVEKVDRVLFTKIMEQVTDRLDYLHAWQPRPIIFRDLKPANVMVETHTWRLRLVDFGISHLAADKAALRAGTRGYLAPEAAGGKTTKSTDIFAMGRLALFLMFGHEGFDSIRSGARPPAHDRRDLPPSLVAAALSLCDSSPSRRPVSALLALDRLNEAVFSKRRSTARPDTELRCPACQQTTIPRRQVCSWCGAWLREAQTQPGSEAIDVPVEGIDLVRNIQPASAELRLQQHLEALARVRSSADLGTLRCLPTIDVTPYPYQLDAAVQVLSSMNGRALIADDVGLGKTIEAGLIIKEYLLRKMINSCLIVSPPGMLLHQIKEEMWTKFRLDFKEYRSNGDDGTDDLVGPRGLSSANLVIVSYNTLARDQNRKQFEARSWDLLVADECHKVSNRKTKRHRAVRALVTRHVVFMSATPFSGKREELWNVYSAIRPGYLGASKWEFEKLFDWNDRPTPQLTKLLRDMTIRRSRNEVLVRFPGRQAVRVAAKADDRFRRIYREVSLATKPSGAFAHLNALQQAVTSYESLRESRSFRLLSHRIQTELRGLTDADHPKVRALIDRVISRIPPPNKAVVFTRLRRSQAALRRLIDDCLPPGETALFLLDHKGRARLEVLERFKTDPAARFLVCGEGAGEGLNLQFSSIMVNVDMPWNPMRLEQRIGRIQRLGQKKSKVTVINLVVEDSVEDRVLEVLTDKLAMFELVVGQTEQILGELFDNKDSNKNAFESWFAEVILADGGVDENRLRNKLRELESAERRAQRQQQESGSRFDRYFGSSGRFESEQADWVQEPPIDLSFLEQPDA